MKVLALLIGVGLALLGAVMVLTTILTWDGADAGMDAFLLAFFAAVTLAGALLIEFGTPGVWKRAAAGTVRIFTTPATLLHPLGHTALLFAIGVAGAKIVSAEPSLPVFAVAAIYSVASPLVIALRPGWWLNAALSLVGFFLLFTALPAAAAAVAGKGSLGEASLILIVPMMVYPAALVLSGVLRLILAKKARSLPRAA